MTLDEDAPAPRPSGSATGDAVRIRLVVRGDVQGVGFREGLRREAEREGVAGWAGNRPDGGVDVVLEGPGFRVARLVGWSHVGPRAARVEAVKAVTERPEGLVGFAIR